MSTNPENTQSLLCSFKVPSRHTSAVQVTVRPNKDPAKVGSCLTFPEQPIENFVGFPICNAKVKSPTDVGYAAVYGWIQMVREAPLDLESKAPSDLWEFDPIPITADSDTPFIWFGPEPQLFDAPFRSNRTEMDWTSWSFLTYIKDSVMSRSVRPILVLEWGFRINGGNVTMKALRLIDVHEAWETQREMLEKRFGSWSFEPVEEDLEVSQMSGRPN
ncbi:hypothetical protein QM012_005076 [Aureobasidium pullulans]|uniref:Uncharacterized protein n=1 Tax=Aureobasidium pullulans TaxID=5580 RepID=A0ABR0T6C9_AURPU